MISIHKITDYTDRKLTKKRGFENKERGERGYILQEIKTHDFESSNLYKNST